MNYFISSLRDTHHIEDIQVMVLEKIYGLSLTSLKPIVQCLDSVPYHDLKFIKLL